MKYSSKLTTIMLFAIFIIGCSSINKQIHNTQVDNAFATSTITNNPTLDYSKNTKLSWKVIDYGGAPYFHLYVTLNEETDYYVGYFFGENFSVDEDSWVSDAPEDALTSICTVWTGQGEWFYMYRKSDSELAIMNHAVGYRSTPEDWDEYKEILVIPLEKDAQIQIKEPTIIYKSYAWTKDPFIVYDGFVLGAMEYREWIPIYEYDLTYYYMVSSDKWGFRLYHKGQYLDTVSYDGFHDEWLNNNELRRIELKYNEEHFPGLAISDGESIRFGDKISLNRSAQAYQDYIAQILADNGLEGENVVINEIVKTDLEDDGEDEVLIIASNVSTDNKLKGQYSIVVLRKIIDGNVESIFLVKDIKKNLSTDLSDSLTHKYTLCEIVDLNGNGVCELIMKREYYEVVCYQVYELANNKLKIVLSNGLEI